MRVSGVQFANFAEPLKNVDKALDFAAKAAERGAKIIVFHQLFHCPWFLAERDEAHFTYAINESSEEFALLVDAAKSLGVNLVCPIFEETDDNRFHNTVKVIDPSGVVIANYRKSHVPSFKNYEEGFYFTPGDELPVFTIAGVKVGFALCWENFFPEIHRTLALQGAELIIAPSAAGYKSADRWMISMSSQAITNALYILRVNRVGIEGNLHFYGDTFCANPMGELLYEPTGEASAVYLVDVDLTLVRKTREVFPYYQDRRPELYTPVTEVIEALELKSSSGQ